MTKSIGIDIGGTSIRAALVEKNGSIIQFEKTETPDTPAEGLKIISAFISSWLKEVNGPVGIAVPGPLHTKTGTILDPPNLPGWHGFALKQEFEKYMQVDCIVENDANAAAAAEYTAGAGMHADSMVYVTISTGVGAGIIAGGHLLSGAIGNGGEVGNMIIAEDGPRQQGLNPGAWESLASGTALGQLVKEKLQLDGGAPALFSALERNVAGAEDVFKQWIEYTARGLANLMHTVDPELIVLGGGVMQAADKILPPLREAVKGKVYQSAAEHVKLKHAELGVYTGVIGAARLSTIRRI